MGKTRDSILLTALDAFGEEGTAQVTTNNIADILEISPGNVYYYFKNKQEIIEALYRCFTTDIVAFLEGGGKQADSPAKMWLVLSLSFQLMVKYRFVFRDANYVVSRYPELRRHFDEVLNKTRTSGENFCQELIDNGLIVVAPQDRSRLTTNMHLVFTQWISYAEILPSGSGGIHSETDPYRIPQGIEQIIDLLLPYLNEDARGAFSTVENAV